MFQTLLMCFPNSNGRKRLTLVEAGVDRGQDFRPRPRKIQLVKTEAEDNRGFFFLTEAEECKF